MKKFRMVAVTVLGVSAMVFAEDGVQVASNVVPATQPDAVVVAAADVAPAAPSTQPENGGPRFWQRGMGGGGGPRGFGYGGGFRRFGMGDGNPFDGPNGEDWAAAEQFMKDHSPERYKWISKLDDTSPAKFRLRSLSIEAYAEVQRAKDDQDLAKAITNRIEINDAIYGLSIQLRDVRLSGGDSGAETQVKKDMKEKVSKLVDALIKEGELRIARLQRTLQKETERLGADRQDRDRIVQRRFKTLTEGAPSPDLPPRGELQQQPSQPEDAGNPDNAQPQPPAMGIVIPAPGAPPAQ